MPPFTSTITRRNADGTISRWAVYGWTGTPLDDPQEPVRTYSPYGWKGSQKYPFGKTFPPMYEYGEYGAVPNDNKFWIGTALVLLAVAWLRK